MINIDSIKQATLTKSPFRYSLITGCFANETIDNLLSQMPKDNYYRSLRDSGSDKTYNVVNNILLKLGEKEYNKEGGLDECWIQLVNDLQSIEYITALSNLLQENLLECHQEITLKRYGHKDFISAHTDKSNVRATHMIFLNKDWNEKWGGQLCLMQDEQIVFKKILPIATHSVAFVRADNSWHSVEEITEQTAERIAIQVAFWNITQRQVLPGRVEETVGM